MEGKSIGQVSEDSGVSRRTLRYYEDLGILRPARTESGYRIYTATDEKRLARMHERWISIHWGPGYGKDEYLGLVCGYLADPRFVSYYDDAAGEGATAFLVKAVEAYQAGR